MKRKTRQLSGEEVAIRSVVEAGVEGQTESLHRVESPFFLLIFILDRKAKRRLQLIISLSFAIQWIFTAKQTPLQRCTVSSTTRVPLPLQLLRVCGQKNKKKRIIFCTLQRRAAECMADFSRANSILAQKNSYRLINCTCRQTWKHKADSGINILHISHLMCVNFSQYAR